MGNSSLTNINNPVKKSYFSVLHKSLLNRQNKIYKDKNNKNFCLLEKSFNSTISHETTFVFENEKISWKNYFQRKLSFLSHQYNCTWATNLQKYIRKNSFQSQTKYQNLFFYEEFQLLTSPKYNLYDKTNENSKLQGEELYQVESSPLYDDNINIDINNNYKKITDEIYNITKVKLSNELLGSLASIDSELFNSILIANNPTLEYKYNKNKLKNYIEIFRKHLCHKDHPINMIVNKFAKIITPIISEKNKELKNNINIINMNEIYDKGKNIIKQIQSFIVDLQVVIKMFYSRSISYKYFSEEKDEFMNLSTFLLFNTEGIYKNIFELIEIMNMDKIKIYKKNLDNFSEIKPEDIGIKDQFCLNQKTKIFMEDYKKTHKNKLIVNDTNNIKCNESNNIINENEDYFDQDSFSQSMPNNNYINTNMNITEIKNEIIFDNYKNTRKYTYLNNTNKLEKEPYSEALNILRKINIYKTPFEKLIILASVGTLITSCVKKFWEPLEEYITPTFLNIEADELMSIYLYIVYKIKMPNLFVHVDFIKYFTCLSTKSTMIGYYYTVLEGCLSTILENDDKES